MRDLDEFDFQRVAMELLIAPQCMWMLSKNPVDEIPVCEWYGVECKRDRIERIAWDTGNHIITIESLAWIPNYVKYILWMDQYVQTTLETRFLPKRLVSFRLYRSQVYGSIELRTLPSNIGDIAVVSNEISGTVDLTDLPETLERINFGNNRIDTVVGCHGALPPEFKEANFTSTYVEEGYFSQTTKPRYVEYISLDGSPMDARINLFEGENKF